MSNIIFKHKLYFLSNKCLAKATQTHNESNHGFTLIEMLITVFMIGILSAIVAPSWIGFVDARRLNTAQDEVYRAMREAQSNAKRDKITWQASFREDDSIVQWAIHPASKTPNEFIPPNVIWNNLHQSIQVYKVKNDKNKCETSLEANTQSCPTNSPWRVQFDYKGQPGNNFGQITLISKNGSKTQRCVYVATILGAMRTGKDHVTANSEDKYCY